jgi:glycosyltransferase involved in cell wall biosynthesis
MNKPNIVMLIPELTMGGAQHSFARLAWALSIHYTIIPVVFDVRTSPFYLMPSEVKNLTTKPAQTIFSKVRNVCIRFVQLRKLKRNLQPVACISFLEGADYLNVLTKQKEKVIISIRGSKVHDPNMHMYMFALRTKFLIPFLYKKADKIVTVNKGIQKELIHYFRLNANKIETIYNYIDALHDSSLQTNSFLQTPYILFSGRLAHEKGIREIVKVFASIQAKIPDLKLVLLGDGPEKENIIHDANRVGLTIGKEEYNQIVLLGSVSNTYAYLKNASVTVLNSVSEGFPNAMAESLLAGKRVVAGDCPYGPRELFALGEGKEITDEEYPIETGGGTLLPPIDEKSHSVWIHAISKIIKSNLNSDELFVSRFKAATSKENFVNSWRKIIQG